MNLHIFRYSYLIFLKARVRKNRIASQKVENGSVNKITDEINPDTFRPLVIIRSQLCRLSL